MVDIGIDAVTEYLRYLPEELVALLEAAFISLSLLRG
jgi:hypothetical protein